MLIAKLSKEQWLKQNQELGLYTDSLFDRSLVEQVQNTRRYLAYSVTDGQGNFVCQLIIHLFRDSEDVRQVISGKPLETNQLSEIAKAFTQSVLFAKDWPSYLVQDSQDLWHHPFRLPANITINGDLRFRPYRSLYLENNTPLLDRLPENLTVNGELEIDNESQLRFIGRGLTVQSVRFDRRYDNPIEHLTVTGELTIKYNVPDFGPNCQCTSLKVEQVQDQFPFNRIKVGQNISIFKSELSSIQDIDCDKLEIRSTVLRDLGPKIQVQDLLVHDCYEIKSISPDIQVRGTLSLQNCVSLKDLPNGLVLTELRIRGRSLLKDNKSINLPKNTVVYNSTSVPVEYKEKTSVPESFCCLGQISWVSE